MVFLAELMKKYEAQQCYLLPILQEVNDQAGYISEEAMQEIADYLHISATTVYGTTTFYSFLNITPKGKYIIRLCKSLSCHLGNKTIIANALETELGIKFGETSEDQKFTLEYTNCMGMCDQGPAMLVNKNVYTNLTSIRIKDIIAGLE